jgi:esterase/lipase
MDELGRAVAREGATVHRGALSGHGGPESYAALARITRRSWIDDFRKLCRAAAAEADAKRVPLRFLGFSLGSLIAMDTMVHDSTVRFDRMVHLAPAVAPRRAAYLSRLLRKDWSLGSRTPAAFRVHDRLPAAAYHALLDSVEALEESGFAGARSHALNVATLVFIDPADELVSPRAVRKTIRRHELDHWRVVEVSAGASDYPHHLLLAREGFEAGGYAEMVGQVSAFLTE